MVFNPSGVTPRAQHSPGRPGMMVTPLLHRKKHISESPRQLSGAGVEKCRRQRRGLRSLAPHPSPATPCAGRGACEGTLAECQMSGISLAGRLRTTSVSGVHLRERGKLGGAKRRVGISRRAKRRWKRRRSSCMARVGGGRLLGCSAQPTQSSEAPDPLHVGNQRAWGGWREACCALAVPSSLCPQGPGLVFSGEGPDTCSGTQDKASSWWEQGEKPFKTR